MAKVMRRRIFIIDVDGTICEDIRNEEGCGRMAAAKPFRDAIRQINRWFRVGHYICLFTARTDEHKAVTGRWLRKHGVKHHLVLYNKPRKIGVFTEYHYIDNAKIRATTVGKKFTRLVTKALPIEVFS